MILNLKKEFFTDREYVLAENKDMKATAFKYSTGVAALKVENKNGYFIILPFQGQQIWRACFCGRELTMKTMKAEPVPNVAFLKTYGGFLLHCGITSVGAPDADHLQHGEIPNIEYDSAYMEIGEDYMAVGGSVDYNVSYVKRYIFSPKCTLTSDATTMKIDVELKNMREDPLEYAYLCHINFAPIYGAKLHYNAKCKTVHRIIPEDMNPDKKKKLIAQLDRLEKDIHSADTVGEDGQFYQPEICCTMIYEGDKGYTLQYKEGEGACYVCHPTDALPCSIRWISRYETEDAMGMVLPSTCEHRGYQYIKENGQLKYLDGYGTLKFTMEAGWIDDAKAKETIKKINNN